MATQVRETSAGKSVSAFIVMNKKGEHVATVNAHFANSGRVTVDVWNQGDKAAERCLAAAVKSGHITASRLANALAASEVKRASWGTADHMGYVAYDIFGLQQGSAGGGGYDKFAAAISGIWIDGVQMTNHCGSDATSQKLMRAYVKAAATRAPGETGRSDTQKVWDAKAAKIGASFANWSAERSAYMSLHISAGLDRLKGMGYTVIQAI